MEMVARNLGCSYQSVMKHNLKTTFLMTLALTGCGSADDSTDTSSLLLESILGDWVITEINDQAYPMVTSQDSILADGSTQVLQMVEGSKISIMGEGSAERTMRTCLRYTLNGEFDGDQSRCFANPLGYGDTTITDDGFIISLIDNETSEWYDLQCNQPSSDEWLCDTNGDSNSESLTLVPGDIEALITLDYFQD